MRTSLAGKGYDECWRLLEQRFGSEILCSSNKLSICLSGKPVNKVGPELSKLVTSIESCFSYMEILESPIETMQVVLIQHMLENSRFPDDLRTDLLKEIARMNKPNIAALLDTLRLYQKMQAGKSVARPTVNTTNAAVNGDKKNHGQKGVGGRKCIVGCTENHPLWRCGVYNNKSPKEKLEVVQTNDCCLNCLQAGHSVESCTSEFVCRVDDCNERHSTKLHNALVGTGPTVNLIRRCDGLGDYLGVQRIPIQSCAAVALWDTGSNTNLVTSQFVATANLKINHHNIQIDTPGCKLESTKMCAVPLTDSNGNMAVVTAAVVDTICQAVHGYPAGLANKVFGSDKTFDNVGVEDINILLGMNNTTIFPREVSRTGNSYLYRSMFGTGYFACGGAAGGAVVKPAPDIYADYGGVPSDVVVVHPDANSRAGAGDEDGTAGGAVVKPATDIYADCGGVLSDVVAVHPDANNCAGADDEDGAAGEAVVKPAPDIYADYGGVLSDVMAVHPDANSRTAADDEDGAIGGAVVKPAPDIYADSGGVSSDVVAVHLDADDLTEADGENYANLKEGDVVQVLEGNAVSKAWVLATVQKVVEDSDGKVRKVFILRLGLKGVQEVPVHRLQGIVRRLESSGDPAGLDEEDGAKIKI
jgi:hypothetical protein